MGEYTHGAKIMSKNLEDLGEIGKAAIMDYHFSLNGIKTKFALEAIKKSKKHEEVEEDNAQSRPFENLLSR